VPPEPLTHIGLPAGATWPRDPRLRRHRHEGAPVIARIDGRPVSCPTDVFLRLAEHVSLLDLVVGDAMVRRGRTTPRELVETTKQAGGRWACHARRAAALVRERVDSPKETELRLLLVLAGFPEPDINEDVLDEAGGWIARPALAYRVLKIALEYDGRHHLDDPRQWEKDIRRRELLDAAGWRVLVVTSRDLSRFASQTLMRVALLLRERGSQDVPSVLTPHRSMYVAPGSSPTGAARIPAGRRNMQQAPSPVRPGRAETPTPPRHTGKNAEKLASRREVTRVAAG
jgi:hypothetical protein